MRGSLLRMFLSLVFLTASGSTAQRLTKVASLLFFGCAPLRPTAVSRPARLRGSHRPGPGLNERGSRPWAPARLRSARQPRGCPVTGFLDFLGRCANRPGRRAPSTCGDAEVRGVPLLVCCRRGGGVAGRPSRPRHAGAPAPRPLPPRYRPFGSRAVGRRGGSRGRRCAPAVGGRGDHLSPGEPATDIARPRPRPRSWFRTCSLQGAHNNEHKRPV